MAKTLKFPMTVYTEDYDPVAGKGKGVTLEAGEEVPSWAEKYVEDEWVANETPYGTAGGTDLVSDHGRPDLLRAAKKLDLEVPLSFSNDQIAAMIRHKLFEDDVKAEFGEDYEGDAVKDDEALFKATNESGNVNAPDVDKKSTKTTASRSSGSDG